MRTERDGPAAARAPEVVTSGETGVMQTSWTCVCGQANIGQAPCDRCLSPAPAWATDPEPPPRRSWVLRALAVAIVVLLVGGLVGVVAVAEGESAGGDGGVVADGAGGGPSHTVRIEPDGSVLDADTPEIASAAREVGELHAFAAEARGLPWQQAVEVTFFSADGFVQRLQEQSERDEEALAELAETARILTALHLLDGGIDLEEEVDDLLAGAVVGFYDPETDELAIRGSDLEAFNVRTTIVHELVHALQDQHFNLHRPELDERDDEASLAFSGLVEGDAVRVERLYLESLPLADQKRAEREELEAAMGAGLDPDTPRILLELIGFPYIYGPAFVDAVVEVGGQVRLDEAFRQPPTTSEQILDPALFLTGVGAVEVTKPPAGGEVIDEGVMGEYVLILLLTRGSEAVRAAVESGNNWRGDWYRAWDDGDRTCVRTRVATEGADATRELQRSLDRWRSEHDGVTVAVEPGGTVLFTSCN